MSPPATVRVNTTVNFPSLVFGTGPITVTKNNGVWSLGFSVAALAIQTPPAANYATDYLLAYDSIAKTFFQLSLSGLSGPIASALNPFSPVLGPVVGSATGNIGIFLTPTVGPGTNSGSFLTPFNLQWGTIGAPIPAGTLGALCGYEANITTNQTNADTIGALGLHAFGATLLLHGGTQAQGVAITATIDTVAPTGYFGVDLNITKNIAGGSAGGFFVGSTGSQPADFAFNANGSFTSLFTSANFHVLGTGSTSIGPNSIGDAVPLSVVNFANAGSVTAVVGGGNIAHLAGPDGASTQIVVDSFSGSNILLCRRSNGSAGVRSGIVSPQNIFSIQGQGWTSAGAYSAAAVSISGAASEAWSGTATGSQITFSTTPNTTVATVVAMTIQNSGGVSIGAGAADPGIGALLAADLYSNDAAFLIRTKTSLTNGAAAAAGTLTNAPAAGNPTKWFSIDDNGTTRRVPAW